MEFTISEEKELSKVVDYLFENHSDQNIILLKGNLGAGKTAFVKSYMEKKQIDTAVSSPTFSLINEYQIGQDNYYHMDLYRLNDLEQAMEIGIEEYLYSGHLCFIEWPEIILPLLPNKYITLEFEILDNSARIIHLKT